jgi:hypothetical protein
MGYKEKQVSKEACTESEGNRITEVKKSLRSFGDRWIQSEELFRGQKLMQKKQQSKTEYIFKQLGSTSNHSYPQGQTNPAQQTREGKERTECSKKH